MFLYVYEATTYKGNALEAGTVMLELAPYDSPRMSTYNEFPASSAIWESMGLNAPLPLPDGYFDFGFKQRGDTYFVVRDVIPSEYEAYWKELETLFGVTASHDDGTNDDGEVVGTVATLEFDGVDELVKYAIKLSYVNSPETRPGLELGQNDILMWVNPQFAENEIWANLGFDEPLPMPYTGDYWKSEEDNGVLSLYWQNMNEETFDEYHEDLINIFYDFPTADTGYLDEAMAMALGVPYSDGAVYYAYFSNGGEYMATLSYAAGTATLTLMPYDIDAI
jgi:hypothetical protein